MYERMTPETVVLLENLEDALEFLHHLWLSGAQVSGSNSWDTVRLALVNYDKPGVTKYTVQRLEDGVLDMNGTHLDPQCLRTPYTVRYCNIREPTYNEC